MALPNGFSMHQLRSSSLKIWEMLGAWAHGIVYLMFMFPFAFLRHIRVHGDEKVYVGQALEMLRAGHWWQQLQFGEVNYIKGPLHYLFLIFGHHIFGFSMVSTVYMNLFLAALAVVGLRSAANYLMPANNTFKALPAWLFAGSGAFVMFTFSSQMDSELTSLYAISLSLSVLARHTNKKIYFALLWLSVGLAGTLKSPLHSCLLGISVLLYFTMSRALWSHLFSSPAKFLFLVVGILAGGAGYLLPFVLDGEKWLGTYMFREQLDRPRYADPASGFLLNNFVLHVIPWSILVIHCFLIAFKRVRTKQYKMDEFTRVGLAFLIPTFAFFFGLGYLAPWYGLPMIPALMMLVMSQLMTRCDPVKDIANAVLPWTVLMMAAVLVCHAAFFGGTPWWSWSTSLLLSSILLVSFLILEAVVSGRKVPARAGVFAGVGLFWCASLGLTATMGESELHDVRALLSKNSAPLNYSNTAKENYSEWGYMAYMTGQPSFYSNSFEELLKGGMQGNWMVFTHQDELNQFWAWMKERGLAERYLAQSDVNIWRRWPRNAGQLRKIWESRSSTENIWDKTTRHFLVLRFTDVRSQVLLEP